MAYYEGQPLKERIERGALALDEAVDIATQVMATSLAVRGDDVRPHARPPRRDPACRGLSGWETPSRGAREFATALS